MNDISIDQDVEEPVEPDGAFEVNARWLTDLDEFNEWMNEEDYLIEDDSGVKTFVYSLAPKPGKSIQ